MLFGLRVSFCVFEDLLLGHRGNLSSRSRSTGNMATLAILYEQRAIVMVTASHINQSKIKTLKNTGLSC
jgi:hypothetical protein